MTTPVPATVTITVGGERPRVIQLADARSLGILDNAIQRDVEEMYDGHGNLIDPQDAPFVKDLTELGIVARSGWNVAVEKGRLPE